MFRNRGVESVAVNVIQIVSGKNGEKKSKCELHSCAFNAIVIDTSAIRQSVF